MNLDTIFASMMDFSSDGIGQVLLQVVQVIYTLLYPSNADPATPVDVPF
ncbi:hypothetical protein [Corynebacterium alimapuense]|nr:hypothetical protein [Corynebacterium alimapuense]